MKKKTIVTLGAIVLMFGLGMNVQYALADYGIEKNSLSIAVLSQSTGGGGDSTSGHGHQNSIKIECSVKTHDGSTSYEHTVSGTKYWCGNDNYVETCIDYDPCAGFYN